MTEKQKRDMWDKIDMEGFDYYFIHYGSYEGSGIKDDKLQELWKAYNDSYQALYEYVKPKEEE